MTERNQKGNEHDLHAPNSPASPLADSDGSALPVRHEGREQLSDHEGPAAYKDSENSGSINAGGRKGNRETVDPEVTQVAQQVFALIQENHLHTPVVLPDAQALASVRENAPEIYDLYVKAVATAIEDESYTTRASYEIPERFTRRGQRYGLISVLASLGIVGYAIYAGQPWIAGVLGTFDLVALAAVFGRSNSGAQKGDN